MRGVVQRRVPVRIPSCVIAFFLAFLCACNASPETRQAVFRLTNGTTTPSLSLEVAATEQLRQLGLMYRKEMAENSGMVFMWDDEKPRTFWMKNTYLELDMFFVDRNFKVVTILEHVPPLTENHRESVHPAQYVVELVGGSAKRLGITPGAMFQMD